MKLAIFCTSILVFLSTVAAAAPANLTIDFSVPAPQQPLTDVAVFDESVIFAPNFALNQNDPGLSPLFDKNGVSNLCFPTSLAETLIYVYGYQSPKLNALKLAGLSQDHGSIAPNDLIRQLASDCKTDSVNGTDSLDAIRCVVSLITTSGYGIGATQLISPFNSDPTLPIVSHDVRIADLRAALSSGFPVILEAGWYSFDATKKSWVRANGHYISVYGYDYNQSWGEDQIQLKVINPETQYGNSRKGAIWDTITVIRASHQPGITYPADRPFILTGSGFGGLRERAFLGMMLTIAPTAH